MKKLELNSNEIKTVLEMQDMIESIIHQSSKCVYISVNLEERIKKLSLKLAQPPKRITVASAKAKGRNLQKWAVEKIAELLNESLVTDKDSNNIRGREMGQHGVDVWIHKSLRDKFPIAVECKAQEKIALPSFIEQAKNNTSTDMPYWLLVLKNKAIKEPVLVMEWNLFEWLYERSEYDMPHLEIKQ